MGIEGLSGEGPTYARCSLMRGEEPQWLGSLSWPAFVGRDRCAYVVCRVCWWVNSMLRGVRHKSATVRELVGICVLGGRLGVCWCASEGVRSMCSDDVQRMAVVARGSLFAALLIARRDAHAVCGVRACVQVKHSALNAPHLDVQEVVSVRLCQFMRLHKCVLLYSKCMQAKEAKSHKLWKPLPT
jgi:hypothetical protein